MALGPKPKPKNTTPRRYTQEEVEAIVRQAYKDAEAPLPTLANRRKMMEQMRNATMDRKMKAAGNKAGVPMKKKKKKGQL